MSGEPQQALELRFSPGEIIFTEGDTSNRNLYILIDGVVEVCKGIFKLAEVKGDHTFLGEMSALLRAPRSATVVAKEACRIYVVPEGHAETFFRAKPGMAMRLATELAGRLQQMNQRYEAAMAATPSGNFSDDEEGADEQATPQATDAEGRLLTLPGLGLLETVEDKLVLSAIVAPDTTFLNQVAVEGSTPIANGDKLQIGGYLLQIFEEHADLIDTQVIEVAVEAEAEAEADESSVTNLLTRSEELARREAHEAEVRAVEVVADTAIEAQVDAQLDVPLTETLQALIDQRLALHAELEELDDQRKALSKTGDLSEDCARELESQDKRVTQIPPLEQLKEDIARLQASLGQEQADPMVAGAMALGLKQVELLVRWEGMSKAVIDAGLEMCPDEPLIAAWERLSIPGGRLSGLTTYLMLLEDLAAAEEQQARALQEQIKEIPEIKGLFRSRPDPEKQPLVDRLTSEVKAARLRAGRLSRERKWLEPRAIDQFWRYYEVTACYLAAGRVQAADEPHVRAFLRWGLLGCAPRFLDQDEIKQILNECARPVREWRNGDLDSNVLYADEYLDLAARGEITPSVDEEMEMNQQGSALWKADRSWRRQIHSRCMEGKYLELAEKIEARATAEVERQTQAAKKLEALAADDPDAKSKRSALRSTVQASKVEAGRLTRIVEKLRGELAVKMLALQESSKVKMEESGVSISKIALARSEVAGIRKVSKLVAKLKEPFLPLLLRRFYRRGQRVVHHRAEVMERLRDDEQRDPQIFQTVVVANAKKSRRVEQRISPIILITPVMGELGFCWTPRHAAEVGCLVMPAYSQRSGLLETICWDLLADYRYGTSKAESGADALKSNTLVAAYANLRWSFRRKSEEARRKAVIYMDESESANWRRHYTLYMRSAHDAGKMLFFKCPELYEQLLKYMELPVDVEPMRRSR